MGMGRTNQRFQQGGPVNAPRWSSAQQEAWRGRQAAPPPDISLPRWGAPQTGMPGAPGAIGAIGPGAPGAIGATGPAGPDISLPRWGAPQPPPVGIPPMGPPAKPWQPPAGGLQPLPGLQPIYGSPPPDISLPRWGAPQTPPVGMPPMGQPPAGRLPPLDPYDPGRGIPNPPVPSPSPWAGRVSGLERPGATRDWRGQQWTMGGAGPNQWTDRLGRGWGRNDGGLTSLYWPGGRVY